MTLSDRKEALVRAVLGYLPKGTTAENAAAVAEDLARIFNKSSGAVLQEWTERLPMMQQTVLLAAIRGPDGFTKYHPVKPVLRWYRRCVVKDALNGEVLDVPYSGGGGSFAGPSMVSPAGMENEEREYWQKRMLPLVDDFMRTMDEFNLHAWLHMLHGFEIVAYGHPDMEISEWWRMLYERMVKAMHLRPELPVDLSARLGDTLDGLLRHSDPAIDRDPRRAHKMTQALAEDLTRRAT